MSHIEASGISANECLEHTLTNGTNWRAIYAPKKQVKVEPSYQQYAQSSTKCDYSRENIANLLVGFNAWAYGDEPSNQALLGGMK